jgi:hypothetical protein
MRRNPKKWDEQMNLAVTCAAYKTVIYDIIHKRQRKGKEGGAESPYTEHIHFLLGIDEENDARYAKLLNA